MSRRSSRRLSPRLGAWLALSVMVLAILAIALLGLWAWQQAAQIQMLRGELAQHNDRQQASEQIAELQATATALELHLASQSTAEPQPDPETATGAGQWIELQSNLEQVNSRLDRLEAADLRREVFPFGASDVRKICHDHIDWLGQSCQQIALQQYDLAFDAVPKAVACGQFQSCLAPVYAVYRGFG